MIQFPMKIHAVGTFTPPPAPCGGEDCRYVDLEVVHADTCPE